MSYVPLSILVTTYDDPRRLALCLAGLSGQTLQNFDLHVVDDGSPTRAAEEVLASYTHLAGRYHYLEPASLEFRAAAARNLGLKHCLGPRVLCLDGDMVPGDTVAAMHAGYRGEAIVACGLRRRIPRPQQMGLTPDTLSLMSQRCQEDARVKRGWQPQSLAEGQVFVFRDPRLCESCHISYPLHVVRELGGFWEAIRGWGGEDVELAHRLQRHGCRFVCRADAVAYHLDHEKQTLAGVSGKMKNDRLTQILTDSFASHSDLVRNGGPLGSAA